jgi:hypothetical protein
MQVIDKYEEGKQDQEHKSMRLKILHLLLLDNKTKDIVLKIPKTNSTEKSINELNQWYKKKKKGLTKKLHKIVNIKAPKNPSQVLFGESEVKGLSMNFRPRANPEK